MQPPELAPAPEEKEDWGEFKVKSGTSDMNIVGPAWKCPILAYGPGDSSLDHTPNEHLDLAEYHQAIATLARVLSLLCELVPDTIQGRTI